MQTLLSTVTLVATLAAGQPDRSERCPEPRGYGAAGIRSFTVGGWIQYGHTQVEGSAAGVKALEGRSIGRAGYFVLDGLQLGLELGYASAVVDQPTSIRTNRVTALFTPRYVFLPDTTPYPCLHPDDPLEDQLAPMSRIRPFVEIKAGYSLGWFEYSGVDGRHHGPVLAAGGGVVFPVHPRFSIELAADYVLSPQTRNPEPDFDEEGVLIEIGLVIHTDFAEREGE